MACSFVGGWFRRRNERAVWTAADRGLLAVLEVEVEAEDGSGAGVGGKLGNVGVGV